MPRRNLLSPSRLFTVLRTAGNWPGIGRMPLRHLSGLATTSIVALALGSAAAVEPAAVVGSGLADWLGCSPTRLHHGIPWSNEHTPFQNLWNQWANFRSSGRCWFAAWRRDAWSHCTRSHCSKYSMAVRKASSTTTVCALDLAYHLGSPFRVSIKLEVCDKTGAC